MILHLEQSKGKHANHDQAVESFLQAHTIAVDKYSGQSEEVADTAHKLALAYSESATAEAETAAEQYLAESLGILQVLHGPHHPKTLAVQEDLCKLMLRMDRSDEAVTALKTLIAAKIETFGDWSEEVGDSYKLFGSIQLSQGYLEKALKNFKKLTSFRLSGAYVTANQSQAVIVNLSWSRNVAFVPSPLPPIA
ncbi:putative tetratricopeptide repeat protein 23 [Apostichopus japonicus]|uniref:Putative tetratricopeptide repeat protein 23 n=1 Tax=Stichopus japonicus TaxID=307972 RepID=A0A2G8KFG5_STIJA|nr:putative tetratricopeptide repeat protein 23 [Apostichopus japonicus]